MIIGCKNLLLLEFEVDRERVRHTNGLAVVTTGLPFRHLGHDTLCLGIEIRVFASYDFYVGDATILFNNKLYYYLTGDTFFSG